MAKIYIDPGHNASGADTGAVGFGLKEQDITVQIGVLLRDLLIENGQTVRMSRESIYDTVAQGLSESLSARYSDANSWNSDLFISIHCNSANSKAYGCETYYYAGSRDGERLAKDVQRHLPEETGRTDRGVKTANFAVIKYTNMPAILVESAFIDNYDDNRFLASESGRKSVAVGIYKGICNYLGIDYNLSEGDDELMSKEYDELKLKNESQDAIISIMGIEINQNNNDIREINRRLARYDYIDTNMPEWAAPTIAKLVEKGFLIGDEDGKLGLTEDLMRQLVINDRAGLYGE